MVVVCFNEPMFHDVLQEGVEQGSCSGGGWRMAEKQATSGVAM